MKTPGCESKRQVLSENNCAEFSVETVRVAELMAESNSRNKQDNKSENIHKKTLIHQ